MKESLKAQDKIIVFRETFQDEASVRANGGTPSGITFSNGVGTFNGTSSWLSYNKALNGTYSVRMRFNSLTPALGAYLFDFRNLDASGVGYVYFSSALAVTSSAGNRYVDGVVTDTVSSSTKEIVVTNLTINSILPIIGRRYSTANYINAGMELLEVYQGTLTANEVLNLYQNKQNEELQNVKTQTATTELIVTANDRTFESGTTGNWVGTYKSTSFAASTEQAHSGTYSAKFVSDGTGAGEVRLSNSANNYISANPEGGYVTAWVYSSHAGVVLSARGLGNTAYASTASTTINGWQQLMVFVPDGVYATTSYGVWFTIPSGATVYLDDISWLKLTNNTYNEILRVDARNGVISNKYSGSVANSTNLVSGWDFTSGWTEFDGNITSSNTFQQTATSAGVYKSYLTTGKKYRVHIKGNLSNSNILRVGSITTYGISETVSGDFDLVAEFVADGVNFYILVQTNLNTLMTIDYISVIEVIPSVTNTATTVVRDGNVWAMNFDGATSAINCGSYNTLVGNKTFIAWINPRSVGEGTNGRLFDNGKLIILTNTTTNRILVYSDGSIGASFANAVSFYKYQMVAITRTSTGITNLFINGVATGTANQSSGTPAVGTTNLFIGNTTAGDRTFDGKQSNVRIIDGILTTQEIAQIYQSEKKLYNL